MPQLSEPAAHKPVRRTLARSRTTETVYAVTDLPAPQANPEEIATWVGWHWTIENNDHHTRDDTFAEDANRGRTRNTPAVLAVLRDIVRGAFRLADWANTASARRAHSTPAVALSLDGIP